MATADDGLRPAEPTTDAPVEAPEKPRKRRGRPPGSKNKRKAAPAVDKAELEQALAPLAASSARTLVGIIERRGYTADPELAEAMCGAWLAVAVAYLPADLDPRLALVMNASMATLAFVGSIAPQKPVPLGAAKGDDG